MLETEFDTSTPDRLIWRVVEVAKIVDEIRHQVQSEKVASGEVPRELSPQEVEEIKAFGEAE